MKRKMGRKCINGLSYGMDQACMEILSTSQTGWEFWTQSSECIGCDPVKIQDVENGSMVVVNATFTTFIQIITPSNESSASTPVCQLSYGFTDDGYYGLNVDECSITQIKDPGNPYFPILFAALFIFFTQIMWGFVNALYNSRHCRRRLVNYYLRLRNQSNNDPLLVNQDFSDEIMRSEDTDHHTLSPQPLLSELEARAKSEKRRVRSLDAFRGLSVAVMIFVNYGGGGYWFFNHSTWNGLTVADLVFPWFMWIMGVSMPISIQSQLRNGLRRRRIAFRVIKRSLILFALGIMINSIGPGNNNLRTLRIPGVLQRFGVSYLITGLVLGATMPREIPTGSEGTERVIGRALAEVRDVILCGFQWFLVGVLITIHTIITFDLKVPGCPKGYLGPGGLHDGGKYSNCTGGSAGYIDRVVLGYNHIYNSPTAKQIYNTNTPYDPEGILGCLTSAALVCFGVQAGITLITFKDWTSRVKRWMMWSVVFGIIGGGLCGFSKEDGIIPLNKNLWSLSFILVMSCMAFFLLTLMYLLIDVASFWSGSPLIYVGMNPILVYMGHEICHGMFPFSWAPFSQSHYEALTMNLWGTFLWMFIAYVLYKKKIFLAV